VAIHISAKFGEQILVAKQSSWVVQNFRIYAWQVSRADTINQGWKNHDLKKILKIRFLIEIVFFDLNQI